MESLQAEGQAALNRAHEGHTGMAALDTAGAFGAPMAAAKFLPKKLRILGGLAAATAPAAEAVRSAVEGHAAGGAIQNFAGGGLSLLEKAAKSLEKHAVGAFDPRFEKRIGEIPKLQNMVIHREQYGPTDIPALHLPDYEGHPFITSISDRSNGGSKLLGINDVKFNEPIDLTGGKLYMYNHPGSEWAAGDVPADNLMRIARTLKDMTGKDPLHFPWQMAPSGSDFSHMTGATMLAHAQAAMGNSEKRDLDNAIKDIIPDWKGIDHPDSMNQFLSLPAGIRGAVQNSMDKNFRDAGGIGIGEARLAIADPEQHIGKDGSISHVGRIFADQDVIRNSGNPSYPSAIPGEGLGKLPEDFNIYQLHTAQAEKRGVTDPANPTRPDLRSIEMFPSSGIITEKALMNMGYKEGGLAHLAPGGSVLKKLLPLAEREGNLAKFLEPSVVKDRLYHGTKNDIKSFDLSKRGASDISSVGGGIYLTPDPNVASFYSKIVPGESGSNVMPVHAQVKNPFEYDLAMPFKSQENSNEFSKKLQDAGYDSIVQRDNNGKIVELVVFEPTQIKSAIGNEGTYNPLDPDITKKRGGLI